MKTVVGAGVVLPRQHDVNLIKSRQIGPPPSGATSQINDPQQLAPEVWLQG